MNDILIRGFRRAVVALAFLLAGCATGQQGEGIKLHTFGYAVFYTHGAPTPRDQHVPREEYIVPGASWTIGEGSATSCGPTGTLSGHNPDGSRAYQGLGC